MALDTFKLKHGGPCPGFFTSRSAQIIFEPGMAGQDYRQARAATAGLFDQLLEAAQGLAMQVMAIID